MRPPRIAFCNAPKRRQHCDEEVCFASIWLETWRTTPPALPLHAAYHLDLACPHLYGTALPQGWSSASHFELAPDVRAACAHMVNVPTLAAIVRLKKD
jgi:hypothetical protein